MANKVKPTEVIEFVEERRIIAVTHERREDQMGDTTGTLVLATKRTSLQESQLAKAIERLYG
jgi:hypothetical protein